MKYLITGGTGFLGNHLARRLVQEGHHVRILDNNIRGATKRLNDILSKIEFIEGDITNIEVVKKACEGIQSVCHLAYINGTEFFYTKPDLVLEVAIKGMVNILDASREEGIKELILASSSEVYQTPPVIPTDETVPLVIPDIFNPRYSYGGGKMACELMAIHWGKKMFDRILVFRPHNVFGPDMGEEHVIPQLIRKVMSSPSPDLIGGSTGGSISIQGDGSQTRAFIFIDDFIDGLRLVMEKGKHLEIFHIGNQEEISIKEVTFSIAKYLKQEIVLKTEDPAKGGTLRRCPDIKKLKALGFCPKVSFQEGLVKTIDWYVGPKRV